MKFALKTIAGIAACIAVSVMVSSCPGKKPSQCRKPDYVDAMTEQAVAFYKRGNYIEALKAAKEAEQCEPDDPKLYYWLGLIYYQKDKPYVAVDYLKKSIENDPGYFESRMALGMIYLDLQKYDDAIEQFQMAADNDYFPRLYEAYNSMGWAYYKKNDLAKAEEYFKKSIDQKKNYCIAYNNLGQVYADKNQSDKAIYNYRTAISLCPKNYARPHLLLGIEYGKRGYYNKACEEFRTAASIKNAPEKEKAMDYMRLYNCPGVAHPPR